MTLLEYQKRSGYITEIEFPILQSEMTYRFGLVGQYYEFC